jgi:hypothetical protein
VDNKAQLISKRLVKVELSRDLLGSTCTRRGLGMVLVHQPLRTPLYPLYSLSEEPEELQVYRLDNELLWIIVFNLSY